MSRFSSPRWTEAFLVQLYQTGGDVTRSCGLVGRHRATVYAYRDRSPRFKGLWDAVLRRLSAEMEERARRRAG